MHLGFETDNHGDPDPKSVLRDRFQYDPSPKSNLYNVTNQHMALILMDH